MANDYVPANDAELASWTYNLVTGLTDHLVDLGLDAADIVPLQTDYTAFNTAHSSYGDKKLAFTAASNDKKNKKGALKDTIRPLVQRVQHAPGMTDEIRGELGLPVRSAPTTHSIGPETPAIFLESAIAKVVIHFGTNPTNERMNSRPAWAAGCNIYRRKAGETEFSLLAFQKASPYTDRITGDGTDYSYFVRYRGTDASQIGDQSGTETIAARGDMAA